MKSILVTMALVLALAWPGAVAAQSNAPAFSVHKNGTNQPVVANAYALLTWSSKVFDTTSSFNLSTGRFTPNVAGKYLIQGAVFCGNGTDCYAVTRKNGASAENGFSHNGAADQARVSTVLDMNGTSDYAELYVYIADGNIVGGGATDTYFTGSLLASAVGSVSQWTTAGSTINYLSGNVGIGTTSPSAKLQVAGDIKVDGNIAAKYQDVAEWVDSTEALEPGTLVVIDSVAANRVAPAAQPYDLRVVGAVSRRPGLMLGEPGAGKVLVAQSGRVRVKVDARYGAVHVGDLLVSSPTRGHAMRSEPFEMSGMTLHRPGTLVGKALEPLEEGTGEILVLLTLQ
jgi:hypothetical protein